MKSCREKGKKSTKQMDMKSNCESEEKWIKLKKTSKVQLCFTNKRRKGLKYYND